MSIQSIMLSGLAGSIATFFVGIQGFLVLSISLVIADWITGVMASRKRKMIEAKKENIKLRRVIESKRLRDTVDKGVSYMLFILASEGICWVFMEKIDWQFCPITYIAAAYIAYTEYKSLSENVEEITGMYGMRGVLKLAADYLRLEKKKKDRPK